MCRRTIVRLRQADTKQILAELPRKDDAVVIYRVSSCERCAIWTEEVIGLAFIDRFVASKPDLDLSRAQRPGVRSRWRALRSHMTRDSLVTIQLAPLRESALGAEDNPAP